jgi:hypothetical protein
MIYRERSSTFRPGKGGELNLSAKAFTRETSETREGIGHALLAD